jgi:lactate permease
LNTLVLFFLALIPIVGLMLALVVFKVPAHVAGLLSLGASALLSFLFWRFNGLHVGLAALEGGLMALWPIMLVIIAAIFTYKLAGKTGSLGTIQRILSGITTDPRIQVLILAWGFGGFLEAVAGYGTAVAIPASILAALGFNPVFAAVVCLIANTVPTAFGALGLPVSTLATGTGLAPAPLSLAVGLQLTPFIILVPFVLVMFTGGGFKALKGVTGITLVAGLGFALPQLWAAHVLGPELPALLGSLTSMVLTILYAKLVQGGEAKPADPDPVTFKQGLLAWLPYLLILVLVLLASPMVPKVNHALLHLKTLVPLYPGAAPVKILWVATPGIMILLAAVVGSLIQGARPGLILRTLGSTAWSLNKATVTVVSILAMAKIMEHSGMTLVMAEVLARSTGTLFPFFAPMIGNLGTFVTGSDTSSNILFGSLQVAVAHRIAASPFWLAAANTAGATAGKMISPQSIVVATSATGLTSQEGKILSRTAVFCVGYALLLGMLVWCMGPLAKTWFPG